MINSNYISKGIEHILDIAAYDHMLFLLALTAVYRIRDWKKVVLLATAFTLGHSLTLIISGLDLFRIKSSWIEFLIPTTILITALTNVLFPKEAIKTNGSKYIIVSLFGLIHGIGFSSYFRMISSDQGIIKKLLSFNIGVEIGQIIIIMLILILGYFVTTQAKLSHKIWTWILSVICILFALYLMNETWPF